MNVYFVLSGMRPDSSFSLTQINPVRLNNNNNHLLNLESSTMIICWSWFLVCLGILGSCRFIFFYTTLMELIIQASQAQFGLWTQRGISWILFICHILLICAKNEMHHLSILEPYILSCELPSFPVVHFLWMRKKSRSWNGWVCMTL